MENPFEEISSYAWNNDRIHDKLLNASLMWNIMMEKEEDLTDDNLNHIFITENFPFEVRFNYELYKKGKGIDLKALKDVLETWVFSN